MSLTPLVALTPLMALTPLVAPTPLLALTSLTTLTPLCQQCHFCQQHLTGNTAVTYVNKATYVNNTTQTPESSLALTGCQLSHALKHLTLNPNGNDCSSGRHEMNYKVWGEETKQTGANCAETPDKSL